MKELDRKIGNIKWLVLDVDGVFTDGKLYFNPEGDYLKAFFVRDGLGIEIARRAGFKIAILTARASAMVLTRAKDLKIDQVIQGCKDKGEGLVNLAALAQVELHEIAYMGDDLIDLPAILRAGFSSAPADAVDEVKNKVDWISDFSGGAGAIRQWVEKILQSQNKWQEQVEFYLQK